MTLTILYFAAVRELVGIDEERIDVPAPVRTIDALARHLEGLHPALAGRLGAVRFAKNEELVLGTEALGDGDVIALIPPVAGG